MKPAVTRFYGVVALSALADMALLIGLIWAALRITGSPLLLGTLLGVSALIPFSIRRSFPALDSTRLSVRRVVLLRGGVYGGLLLIALAGLLQTLAGFVVAAVLVGVLNYMTTSAYEAANTKQVLAGLLDSQRSARWMQTAFQLGAFSGAFLGGLVLDRASLDVLVYAVAGLALLTAGVAAVLPADRQPPAPVVRRDASAAPDGLGDVGGRGITLLCLALGMIGFHIGAFNTLIPLVYQRLHGWSSADFGLASGIAGVGAFLAAILPWPRGRVLLWAGLLVVGDYLLAFSPLPWVSMGICLLIGFGINTLRIDLRQQMIEAATTTEQANRLAATSSVYFIFLQSAAPLGVGLLCSEYAFGPGAAPHVFVGVGGLLLGAVLLTRMHRPRAALAQ